MKNIKQFALFTLGISLLASCAKEKSYDEVYKEPEMLKKSDILTKKADGTPVKYLYVPMTLGTPREVKQANPFYQGDEKIVKLEFTKDGLEVYELEKDSRFSNNNLNDTPVMTIPVEYKQFKCVKDSYGDCTNKEEENTDLTWDKKDYFIPNYADLEVKEVNMLDLSNIEGDSCVKGEGVKLVDYEVSKNGVVNIELEKTYKLSKSWKCIRSNYSRGKLSYNSFKVNFFYSMVALDKLATKGYQKSRYDLPNHGTFGFFKDKTETLNDVYDSQRKDVTYLANRWDPKKTVVKYYLSKSYNSKKNRPILEATMRAQDIMNKNLTSAGVGFRIQFVQQSESDNISPGDLRYNSIVLIDDPLANGLLGYAPTVSNPETGEIVQGHVNMYGGVLTSGTRWVYENAVDIMEQQVLKADRKTIKVDYDQKIYSESKVPAILREYKTAVSTPVSESLTSPVLTEEVKSKSDFVNMFKANQERVIPLNKFEAGKIAAQEQFEMSFDNKAYFDKVMSRNFEGMSEMDKQVAIVEADELGYKLHSKHAPEFFPIAGTKKVVYPALLDIPQITNKKGILKRWESLSKFQQDKVKEIIIVNRYISTFVHEMGHSLGLRHNFAGSTDAANFYTDVEAKLLGMKAAPAYSSVMDYAVSEFNELGSFGKYDIAALRFNYTGTLGAKDGTAIKVPEGAVINKFRSDYNEEIKAFVKKQAKTSGLPDWPYERIIKFLKTDVIDNEEYPEETRNFWRNIYAMDSKTIAEYKYCTDENAGLSATCNRFDEGTNLYEIAKFRTGRYQDVYKYRNFRDDRKHFKSSDLDTYVVARYREFGKIRDIMGLYGLYANIFGQDALKKEGCKEEEIQGDILCELNESVKVVGDMFLNILKTPDLTCAVGDIGVAAADDKAAIPAKVTALVKMVDIMENRDISKLLRQRNHFLTTCFDPIVKEYFKSKKQSVIGEVGKFLNSHRDSNPNYKYADDIFVRGMWTDKTMAMRFLFERRHSIGTTDESQLALIDHPYIKKEFKKLMKHMILGKKLENPLPFITEAGEKFYIPYIIEANTKIDQIQDNLGWIKRYLKMEQAGSGNLLTTILAQVQNAYLGIQGEAKMKQFTASNYVTAYKYEGYLPEQNRIPNFLSHYIEGNRQRLAMSYQASKVNSIAYEILTVLTDMDQFEGIPKESFKKIIAHKIRPQAPASYSDIDKGFFGLEKSQQEVIVSLLERADIPLEAFEKFAGSKEIAGIMFASYTKMQEVGNAEFLEKIIAEKVSIIANGPLDATKQEKILLGYDLDFLQDIDAGRFTKEVIDYYENQLEKLPQHIQ